MAQSIGNPVQLYDRDMKRFNHVMQSTAERIDKAIRSGIDDLVMLAEQQRELQAANDEFARVAPILNDRILERERMSRSDWENGRLPAYVEEQLLDEPDVTHVGRFDEQSLASLGHVVASKQASLFEMAYHVLPVLPESTVERLGTEFRDYVADRSEEEAREQVAEMERFRKEHSPTVFKGKEGHYQSLVGPDGTSVDDGYGFDEYD